MLGNISTVTVLLENADLLILNEAGIAANNIGMMFDLHHEGYFGQLIAQSVRLFNIYLFDNRYFLCF
jgi:hypothetical protein